ncbi:MAG: hypothetical protein LAT64_12160 [Phycisphaerales bacterium]|nr:hypothetical protein [Planctomycetota bacterium]MCH8509507.1 hypothetical protein [Phycisphaerales bacterium]
MPMSLLSATVLRVRPAGVTVDFCPVCRQERRFRLAVLDHRRIVLLLDRGQVGHPHHELTCKSCGCKTERPAEERPMPHIPAGPAAETYEPECLPIVRQRIEDCTRMEAARKAGRLKPEGREEMIRHAVHCFARIYDEEPTERITPAASAMLWLATIGLAGVALFAWFSWNQPLLAAGCALALLLLWIGLWYWIMTHSPRKRVRIWLAMALAPLDATEAEIRQARRELQAIRMSAGFKIRPHKVRGRIERIRKSGMVPG